MRESTRLMMRRTMRPTLLGLALASAVSSTGVAADAATGSFRQTLDVETPLDLEVTTGAGSITIRHGAVAQVEIAGEINVWRGFFSRRAEEAEEAVRWLEANPPIELAGNRLTVGRIDNPEYRRNVSISYELTVPADTTVRSTTGSGSQRVSGLAGPVEASTGSGEVELSDIGGAVEASTGSGSIRAERIAGAFTGHTGSGSIRLTQTSAGDVDVSTGSGTAELSGIDGAARVRTGSGGIRLQGRQSGTWDLQTGSGSIRVDLPDDAAFEIDARTSSGSISSEHPVTMQGTIERGRLHGEVRGGGPLVQLRTGSGDIRVE